MTNITGLDNLVPLTNQARVLWSTCGVTDEAILSVPVSTLVSTTLILRASGLGQLWPSTGTDAQADSNLTGEIVFTVPLVNKALYFADMSVSVHFTSSWSSTLVWPDVANPLFARLPLDAFLFAWSSELNGYYARKLKDNIKLKMLVPSISIACTLPTFVPMICTAAMKSLNDNPTAPCHPCDKCCKCFVQQRCDAGCDECACLSCNGVKSTVMQIAVSSIVFVFAAFLFLKCYMTSMNLLK